jgi:hypothetical protein
MKLVITAMVLAAVALVGASAPTPAHATDMTDFRWDHDRGDCRLVEIRSINRWGDDVTVHRRVCG